MKRLSINASDELHKSIKVLALMHDITMTKVIAMGVSLFAEQADTKKEVKNLKNQIYRLKYDAVDKDK